MSQSRDEFNSIRVNFEQKQIEFNRLNEDIQEKILLNTLRTQIKSFMAEILEKSTEWSRRYDDEIYKIYEAFINISKLSTAGGIRKGLTTMMQSLMTMEGLSKEKKTFFRLIQDGLGSAETKEKDPSMEKNAHYTSTVSLSGAFYFCTELPKKIDMLLALPIPEQKTTSIEVDIDRVKEYVDYLRRIFLDSLSTAIKNEGKIAEKVLEEKVYPFLEPLYKAKEELERQSEELKQKIEKEKAHVIYLLEKKQETLTREIQEAPEVLRQQLEEFRQKINDKRKQYHGYGYEGMHIPSEEIDNEIRSLELEQKKLQIESPRSIQQKQAELNSCSKNIALLRANNPEGDEQIKKLHNEFLSLNDQIKKTMSAIEPYEKEKKRILNEQNSKNSTKAILNEILKNFRFKHHTSITHEELFKFIQDNWDKFPESMQIALTDEFKRCSANSFEPNMKSILEKLKSKQPLEVPKAESIKQQAVTDQFKKIRLEEWKRLQTELKENGTENPIVVEKMAVIDDPERESYHYYQHNFLSTVIEYRKLTEKKRSPEEISTLLSRAKISERYPFSLIFLYDHLDSQPDDDKTLAPYKNFLLTLGKMLDQTVSFKDQAERSKIELVIHNILQKVMQYPKLKESSAALAKMYPAYRMSVTLPTQSSTIHPGNQDLYNHIKKLKEKYIIALPKQIADTFKNQKDDGGYSLYSNYIKHIALLDEALILIEKRGSSLPMDASRLETELRDKFSDFSFFSLTPKDTVPIINNMMAGISYYQKGISPALLNINPPLRNIIRGELLGDLEKETERYETNAGLGISKNKQKAEACKELEGLMKTADFWSEKIDPDFIKVLDTFEKKYEKLFISSKLGSKENSGLGNLFYGFKALYVSQTGSWKDIPKSIQEKSILAEYKELKNTLFNLMDKLIKLSDGIERYTACESLNVLLPKYLADLNKAVSQHKSQDIERITKKLQVIKEMVQIIASGEAMKKSEFIQFQQKHSVLNAKGWLQTTRKKDNHLLAAIKTIYFEENVILKAEAKKVESPPIKQKKKTPPENKKEKKASFSSENTKKMSPRLTPEDLPPLSQNTSATFRSRDKTASKVVVPKRKEESTKKKVIKQKG